MSAPLPERLDPWRAVKFKAAFAGEASLRSFPRLAEAVLGTAGPARYEIRFGLDEQGQAVARGHVSMVLRMTCQRCLGEFEVSVDTPIALGLVHVRGDSDRLGLTQVEGLAGDLEPLPLGDDEPVRVLDWLEDELLLALPQVPMHPAGHCVAAVTLAASEEMVAERPRNPFAALAALQARRSGPEADEQ
jgi:uncharacterized protein